MNDIHTFLLLPFVTDENSDRKHNWSYINFLRLGNKILLPKLNIPDDDMVKEQFQRIFKDCNITQIDMLPIIKNGGGALNCLSWTVKQSSNNVINKAIEDKDIRIGNYGSSNHANF